MRKIVLTLLFGGLFCTGLAMAGVDCDAITPCQFPDPTFDGAPQPAVRFTLSEPQIITFNITIWDGLDCQGQGQPSGGALDLPAGEDIVFLQFDPPRDLGTEISVNWQIGDCQPTGCINYTIGSDPPACSQNKEAGAGYVLALPVQ